jgi:dTMP kinase
LAIHRRSEMLLYMAARAQLVEEVIRPALETGKTVVSDRYLLANVVYQGHAGGLAVDDLWQVGDYTVAGVVPDLTVVFDMPADRATARLTGKPDRMESQGEAFHRRVREGFLAEARQQPQRIVVIDAGQSMDQVESEVRRAVEPLIRARVKSRDAP